MPREYCSRTQALNTGRKVLTGEEAVIDTTTAQGELIFSILAALAEFERERIPEWPKVSLESARDRGRKGKRPFKITPAKARMAGTSMESPDTFEDPSISH